MNRREILSAAGTFAAAAFVAPAMAEEHMHHDHAAMMAPNAKLIATALDCVRTGDACQAHCFDALVAGDLSLAACAKTVDEVIAVCGTLAKLASHNSPNLAAYAKAAALVCKTCEAECRKHADKHATCKACAEACVACAEECGKLS